MEYLDYYKDEQFFYHYNISEPPFFHKYGMHAHEIYEIFFLISGSGIISVEGNEYTLKEKTLYLMRSNEAHFISLDNSLPYERKVIHFFPQAFTLLDSNRYLLGIFEHRTLGHFNEFELSDTEKIQVDELFKRIYISPASEKRIYLLSGVMELLCIIAPAFYKKTTYDTNTSESPWIAQVLFYIHNHLGDNLSLSSVSEHFQVSPYQLNSRIKKATHLSLASYTNSKRMIYAKTLLLDGLQANDVAVKCGYDDYSSFYRAYKKYYNESPIQK